MPEYYAAPRHALPDGKTVRHHRQDRAMEALRRLCRALRTLHLGERPGRTPASEYQMVAQQRSRRRRAGACAPDVLAHAGLPQELLFDLYWARCSRFCSKSYCKQNGPGRAAVPDRDRAVSLFRREPGRRRSAKYWPPPGIFRNPIFLKPFCLSAAISCTLMRPPGGAAGASRPELSATSLPMRALVSGAITTSA